jgi:hypothetical protein
MASLAVIFHSRLDLLPFQTRPPLALNSRMRVRACARAALNRYVSLGVSVLPRLLKGCILRLAFAFRLRILVVADM